MIEIMTFRLRSDADIDGFLRADERVQTDVAYQQHGLLRRTTARRGDRWLILQVWTTEQAADAGAQALQRSDVGGVLIALIDSDSVSIERFDGLD